METSRLQALEAAATSLDARLELAWHLRQRDSRRALVLADEIELLLGARASAAQRLRLALLRCEALALFARVDQAEQQWVQACALLPVGSDAGVDLALAEMQLAKARGERAAVLAACERAAAAGQAGRDPRRARLARAWLQYEQAFGGAGSNGPVDEVQASRTDPALDALSSGARAVRLLRRDPTRGAALLLHVSTQAQRVGLLRDAIIATVNAGSILGELGDHQRAADCMDLAESAARQTGWPALLGICRTQLGAFLSLHGRLEQAHRLLVDAHRALAAAPTGENLANACYELSVVLLRMGRPVEAIEPAREAVRMYQASGTVINLAQVLCDYAQMLSGAGQAEAAMQAVVEARAIIAMHGLPALGVRVHRALAAIHRRHDLKTDEALQAPTAALHHGERALAEGARLPGWKAPAQELIALADDWAAAGDSARAFAYARRAIEAQRDEAALGERLRAPLAPLFSSNAAPPLDKSGHWRPAFARLTDKQRDTGDGGLSAKELQVLRLVARGYSNKEIAASLRLGDETVKWHLKRIFAKLGVGSRKHAASRARALGLVDFS